jgi:hypothetical protein
MPSLIESLIAQGVERKDNKRITAMLRPLPIKQRDVFDLIVAQGRQPSFQALLRSVEMKSADPRALTFVMLGRWPTEPELTALPTPYQPKLHLRHLLQSPEFRQTFVRRLLDAFPDRRRLLFVRIPRSAGAHVLATAANRHPIMPHGIADAPDMSLQGLLDALGEALYRFNSASTAFLESPRLKPLFAPTQPDQASADILHWALTPPPFRSGDTLFTVVREPRSLLLSRVNALLSALQGLSDYDPETVAQWRLRLGNVPAATAIGNWKDIGRQVLQSLTLSNPICEALGEGTAEQAFVACRCCGIELVDLTRCTDWIRTAFSNEPPAPLNVSQPLLAAEDLRPDDRAHLDALLTEDLVFYDRYASRIDPTQVSSLNGANL